VAGPLRQVLGCSVPPREPPALPAGFPTPETGKVVRVTSTGGLEDIATGLTVPTAMTFGTDGQVCG
jgi:hypothetical protein